jgi:hypothetical protein
MPSIKPRRILVAYSMVSTYVPTTLEYLLALKNFTNYEVEYVHVTHGAWLDFDINEYDVVFQNYCARLCFDGYVSEHYQKALTNFRGLKILAVQDDYDRTATLHRAIRRLGFHVLLTCIQSEFWPLVYPRSELPGLTIIQGLTGYVPGRLLERPCSTPPLADRKTWVAYRGRDIGAKYGRLGFEKYEIGRRMKEICTARGVPHDIAMDDASRIYDDAWFEFLGSSRTMLGSESGSNSFDFDGHLEEAINAFAARHGHPPTYSEFKDILDPLEAPFDVGQISPRVFECATMMTPMILFRGRYSNAIEADVHYITLEKDFSNVEAILARLDDFEYLQGFADRAYQRVVQSGDYGYRSLARLIEATIEEQYPLRIDPNWVTYRSQTTRRWTSVDRSAQCKMEEAPLAALGERPTTFPLGISEFNERRTHEFNECRTHECDDREIDEFNEHQTSEFNECQVQGACGARIAPARRAWRLIPTAQRYRIAGWIHKLVADRDQGRPLPSGLSLIRPVWLLLPRRVRRGIVSPFSKGWAQEPAQDA